MNGIRIRDTRKKLGLSANALGENLGVSGVSVYRWESGVHEPDDRTKFRLAAELRVSVAYLMGETNDPTPTQAALSAMWAGSPPSHVAKIDEAASEFSEADSPAPPPKHEVESNIAPINLAHMIRVRILPKDYRACCGNGIDWGPEAIDFEAVYAMPLPELAMRYGDDDVIGVYAEGDSMEPLIFEDDLVLFVPHEKTVANAGMMMVVCYNGRMMIRGVIENSRKQLTLRAKNKEYQDIVVTPDDDFVMCGRVVTIHSVRRPQSVL